MNADARLKEIEEEVIKLAAETKKLRIQRLREIGLPLLANQLEKHSEKIKKQYCE